MKYSTKETIIAYTVGIIIITFFLLIALLIYQEIQNVKRVLNFADCLTKKGVVLFTIDGCAFYDDNGVWNPCAKQRDLFGGEKIYLRSKSCTYYYDSGCNNYNVSVYPTWGLSNGTKLEGIQNLSYLSEVTGCPIN